MIYKALKNLIPAHKELALQAEEGSVRTLITTLKRPPHRDFLLSEMEHMVHDLDQEGCLRISKLKGEKRVVQVEGEA